MKEKRKIVKIVLSIIILLLISITIATVGIGNYFVDYAISRTGNGGEREIKNEELKEQVNNNSEKENIIERKREEERKLAEDWIENTKSKKVEVIANDNITLRGTEYFTTEKSNKWVIILHGYHSSPDSVISIGRHFAEENYNVLIPSMRASNESEGKYIGMGWLDKEDLKCWIDLIINENKDAKIVLHGSSMGGATVLMASGENLPNNIKAIVEDSGYTSVWDIFDSEAKARFNLPSFPILNMFQIVANVRAKYDIKEASALEQVKKARIPILFIHGENDDFVPEYMCEELYNATTTKKEKLIVKGAGHTEARYKEPENYYNKIFGFLNKISI